MEDGDAVYGSQDGSDNDEQLLRLNPFSQLFPSVQMASMYRLQQRANNNALNSSLVAEAGEREANEDPNAGSSSENRGANRSNVDEQIPQHAVELNKLLQDIFLFTLDARNNGSKTNMVHLTNLADMLADDNKTWLDIEVLEQGLFERLMMSHPRQHLAWSTEQMKGEDCRAAPAHATEDRLVYYLVECYRRAFNCAFRPGLSQELKNSLSRTKDIIATNMATAFREPELYSDQNLTQQLSELMLEAYEYEECLTELLTDVADIVKREEGSIDKFQLIIYTLMDKIRENLSATSLMAFSERGLVPIYQIIKSPTLAKMFIQYSLPCSNLSGAFYESSLLGLVLSKSCLPANDGGPWDYFFQPSGQPQSVHARTEAQIWSSLEFVHSAGFNILNTLIRSNDDVKHLTLMWLGDCLHANSGRGKMWTAQMGGLSSGIYASDGFMLNLGSTLLRFCNPLSKDPKKMDKVDGSYCAKVTVVSEDARLAGAHMRDLAAVTCITALPEGEERETSASYSFSTEIFFMAHRALDLGFRTVQEKFVKLNQDLNRLQGAHRDAVDGGSTDAAEQIMKRMDETMSKYLNIKAALLEPSTLEAQHGFLAASSSYLLNLATGSRNPDNLDSFTDSPKIFAYIPEFIIENLCEHLLLVRRFNPAALEQFGGERLSDIFVFILAFMGKPAWLKNPHLRARMAESLECLLPHHEIPGLPNILGNFQRQALFQDHPKRLDIVTAILHVFVSIEETGQAVQFEQKFSYRRPMYDVIKYIWDLDENYKKRFSDLAESAEKEIESESPPLFLRFLNLLINDAIFLLDEGLTYMRTLQEQEGERDQWATLPVQERAEREGQHAHTGQMARYLNIMGKETIGVLELLTQRITAVITHPTMADRLAAMLNYFLKTLTGPERKSFKVKNLDQYSFKPGDVVAKISQMYINLKDSDTFLASVSRDGRSYRPELFDWCESVLLRIHRTDLVVSLQDIAKKVATASCQQAEEDDLLSDAPEEFLCPIMSIIMTDPVVLPSSKKTVDRSTIARHLLSDQSDPFNRAALTMDQVKPDLELKNRVEAWIKAKKEGRSTSE